MIEVRTQKQLDAALQKNTGELIAIIGDGWFDVYRSATVTAYDSATVRACDSATVTAYGSATVRAYGSATVTAYGSATVTAYGSATVTAYGSATVTAYGSATVTAAPYTAVHRLSAAATIIGGVIITPPHIDTPQAWLDYHGVTAKRGVVTLYKCVDDEWTTPYKTDYSPGSKPVASDFDAAPRDCGRGLHGCASPAQAQWYHESGTHFVAVPIKVADLGHPNPDGDTGKIRFRAACRPVYEVDINGGEVAV